MAHRFLSPAAAEAFTDVTSERVRADLAELDAVLPMEPTHWPEWVDRLDSALGRESDCRAIVDHALRFLADQAATVVDSQGRKCTSIPIAEPAAYRHNGNLVYPAGPEWQVGERLDLVMLVPVEEA